MMIHDQLVRIKGSPVSVSVILGTTMTLSDKTPLVDSTIYHIDHDWAEIVNVLLVSDVPSPAIVSDHE